MKKLLFLTTLTALLFTTVNAQQDKSKRPSPPAKATETIASGATITIDYSQPSVKGRTIGKEIAPFGQVWRLGANEPTTFETNKEVRIDGKALPAGKYSMFAIPGESEWTFIFNSEIPRWGIGQDGKATENPEKDVLRVVAKPKKASMVMEQMTFHLNKSGKVTLMWGDVEVGFDIK